MYDIHSKNNLSEKLIGGAEIEIYDIAEIRKKKDYYYFWCEYFPLFLTVHLSGIGPQMTLSGVNVTLTFILT